MKHNLELITQRYYTKSVHIKRRLCKKGHQVTGSFYRLALIWSKDSQVQILPPKRRNTLSGTLNPHSHSHTHSVQSHISSGISWGLRIPGTDICSLCFSSWAWRSDASRSSRNKSVVSSPANSWKTERDGERGGQSERFSAGQHFTNSNYCQGVSCQTL